MLREYPLAPNQGITQENKTKVPRQHPVLQLGGSERPVIAPRKHPKGETGGSTKQPKGETGGSTEPRE